MNKFSNIQKLDSLSYTIVAAILVFCGAISVGYMIESLGHSSV